MALKRENVVDKIEREVITKRYCSTVGCEQVAMVGQSICEACDNRIRTERTTAANRARGLETIEQMKAYCKRTLRARLFTTKPSFERWSETMTQATVDLLILHAGKPDEIVLERLRAIGALDENNKLVPLADRPARRAAIEAKQKAERERIDAELRARGIVRRDMNPEGAT